MVGGGDGCTAGSPEGETVEAEVVWEGDGLTVVAAFYPLPHDRGSPWSQWGQGVVAGGAFFSAVGDHLGVDGNSYLYVYHPDTRTLTRFSDVLSLTDHRAGDWGYGKIHAPMVASGCVVYAATYWGTRRNLSYRGSYQGDLVLQVDVTTGEVTNLGVAVPGRGIPSMALSGRLYLEAVDPFTDRGLLAVFDPSTSTLVDTVEVEGHDSFRALLVDREGRVHLSAGGRTVAFDPSTGSVEPGWRIPGGRLRAATTVGDLVVGATDDPARIFRVVDDRVVELGDAGGYTASVAIDPETRAVYWMPDAHGGAWRSGAPIYRLDLDTGERSTLIELQPTVGDALGVVVGGTYDIVFDPLRRLLYVGLNTGDEDLAFGLPVLAVVSTP